MTNNINASGSNASSSADFSSSDEERRSIPWRYIILTLLLALPLMWLLRDVARSMIVMPIRYALWVGEIILAVVPQPFFWMLFLLLVLRIAIRSLARGKKRARRKAQPPIRYPGQVEVWLRRINLTSQGNYSKWGLARYLGRLTLDILAYQGRYTPNEIREQLRAGQLNMDPSIEAYLLAGVTARPPETYGLFAGLRRRLSAWFKPLLELVPRAISKHNNKSEVSPLDLNPEGLVKFLEEKLEVPYEY